MSSLSRFDIHRPRRVAIAVLLGISAAGGTIPAAQAAPTGFTTTVLSCEGTDVATYDPPLVNTPRETKIRITEDLHFCPIGGVSSGHASAKYTTTTSCTAVTLPPPLTVTYRWNTGASSTVIYSIRTVERLANGSTLVTYRGTVTRGFAQGAIAVQQKILPQPDPTACFGDGVAQLSGPETLTFA